MANRIFLNSSFSLYNDGIYKFSTISVDLAKELIIKAGDSLIVNICEPFITKEMNKVLGMEIETNYNEVIMDPGDVMIAYSFSHQKFSKIERLS